MPVLGLSPDSVVDAKKWDSYENQLWTSRFSSLDGAFATEGKKALH